MARTACSRCHVHLLVPGEGPALEGGGWKRATAPADSPNSDGYYLVDADGLRRTYRTRAIRKLRRSPQASRRGDLRSEGKLKLGGKFAYLQSDENWEEFIRQLESREWVAYIQPPPGADQPGQRSRQPHGIICTKA